MRALDPIKATTTTPITNSGDVFKVELVCELLPRFAAEVRPVVVATLEVKEVAACEELADVIDGIVDEKPVGLDVVEVFVVPPVFGCRFASTCHLRN